MGGQYVGAPKSLVGEWVFELNLQIQVSPAAILGRSIFSSAYDGQAATLPWLSELHCHSFLCETFCWDPKARVRLKLSVLCLARVEIFVLVRLSSLRWLSDSCLIFLIALC